MIKYRLLKLIPPSSKGDPYLFKPLLRRTMNPHFPNEMEVFHGLFDTKALAIKFLESLSDASEHVIIEVYSPKGI